MMNSAIRRATSMILLGLFVSSISAQGTPPDSLALDSLRLASLPIDSLITSPTLQDSVAASNPADEKPVKFKPLPFELSKNFSQNDKHRKRVLLKKQDQMRGQLDILSMQLLWINEQLQNPDTRVALSKKMKEAPPTTPNTVSVKEDDPQPSLPITARSIDLAAVELIRNEGLSLDQARLAIIEGFSEDQVAQFYKALSREERYALYDVIDKAMFDESYEFNLARKSAIFFHLYAY